MKHDGTVMAPRILEIEHMGLQWCKNTCSVLVIRGPRRHIREYTRRIGYQRTKETHKGMHQIRNAQTRKNGMERVYEAFYKTGVTNEGGAAPSAPK